MNNEQPVSTVSSNKRWLRLCAVLLSATVLASCSGTSKPIPTIITISAASDINLHKGRARPTFVRVFALRSDNAFSSADPKTLAGNVEPVFGDDLIDVQEYVIAPGEGYDFELALAPETNFVAAAGFFRDTSKPGWRAIIPIKTNKLKKKKGKALINVAIEGSKVLFVEKR